MFSFQKIGEERKKPRLDCQLCSRSFKFRRDLADHMRAHTGERPFSCGICNKAFGKKLHLSRHLLSHTGEKFFSCDVCHKEFQRGDVLAKHILTHTGEREFTCDVCKKSFLQKSHLKSHYLIHTGQKPFSCEICSKKFARASYLQIHLNKHSKVKNYACDVCDKKFRFKQTLTKHMALHAGEKRYQCDVCGEKFIRYDEFNKHENSHITHKTYTCSACPFLKFSDVAGYRKHLLLFHAEDKPFVCDVCNRAFSRQLLLSQHLLTHAGSQLNKCSECDRVFAQKEALDKHRLTHAQTHTCDFCKKSFLQYLDLKNHINSTHQRPRPYVCGMCNMAFTHNQYLKLHMKSHTNIYTHKCKKCGQVFRLRCHLLKHVRKHVRSKPFVCDVCFRGFKHKDKLEEHFEMHSEKKTPVVIYLTRNGNESTVGTEDSETVQKISNNGSENNWKPTEESSNQEVEHVIEYFEDLDDEYIYEGLINGACFIESVDGIKTEMIENECDSQTIANEYTSGQIEYDMNSNNSVNNNSSQPSPNIITLKIKDELKSEESGDENVHSYMLEKDYFSTFSKENTSITDAYENSEILAK